MPVGIENAVRQAAPEKQERRGGAMVDGSEAPSFGSTSMRRVLEACLRGGEAPGGKEASAICQIGKLM